MNPNINIKIIRDNPEQFIYHSQLSKNAMAHYPYWNFVKSLNCHSYILK